MKLRSRLLSMPTKPKVAVGQVKVVVDVDVAEAEAVRAEDEVAAHLEIKHVLPRLRTASPW